MPRLYRLTALCAVVAMFLQPHLAVAALMARPQAAARPALSPASQQLVPRASEALIVEFTLGRGAPTYACDFTAPADGTYTAAANWQARVQMKVTVKGPPPGKEQAATGPPPQGVPFQAQQGKTYTITVGPVAGSVTTTGELAILVGTGETARKRMPPGPDSLAAALSTMEQKDAILPLVVRLMDRHLQNTRGKNELDQEFQQALAQHPRVSREMLAKFVNDFNAVPMAVKQKAFVAESLQGPRLAPVTRAAAKSAIVKSLPPIRQAELQQLEAQQLQAASMAQAQPHQAQALQQAQAPPQQFQIAQPRLTGISPAAGPNGYEVGSAIAIAGTNFRSGANNNRVEFWQTASPPPPPATPPASADAHAASTRQVNVLIPADLSSGAYHVRVYIKDSSPPRYSNALPITIFQPAPRPPDPAITGISPEGIEPGKPISISGQNFEPGKLHKVHWHRNDPDGVSGALVTDCQAQTTTLIRTTVPFIAQPGMWDVKVRVMDEYVRMSPPYIYEVAPPQYRVTFTKMKCLDESNPEWWGSDEIVTFWGVVADDHVWKKNTDEYGGFDDGDEKAYKASDQRVFPVDANWGHVRYGLVIVTDLYEWDAGDVEAVQDFIGLLGDVGAGLSLAGLGTAALAAIIEAVAWFLKTVIGAIASWFGGDPDHLGTQELNLTWNHLQQLVSPGQNYSRALLFQNSGSTGSYRLNYTISRR